MRTAACPDSGTLELLLLGKLASPVREQYSEHLLHCDECVARAETITASDEFTAALSAPRSLGGEDEHLDRAIQHAIQLRSEAETAGTDDTAMQPGRDAVDSGPPGLEWADFLSPAEQPDEIGRLAEYRVLEVMGVGGMGVVFRAEDPSLKRQVVLKVMKPSVAARPLAKERFLREAQATAAIEHDHIVQIYQVGEDRDVPFIAMQLLRGESLQTRLTRSGRLDQRELLRIGREVATGLAAAHKRGLIHRDIKPDNLWIEEETGRVKILDFGLVRSVDDGVGLTHSEMVLGTPRYMAPEQAQGIDVDHRCDLFSLGSVLYHLAGARPPFDRGNLTATLMAVAHHDPEPIAALAPELRPEFASLIMRLLEKDPDRRPQSADDVAQVLKEIEVEHTSARKMTPSAVAETETIAWRGSSDRPPKAKSTLRKQLVFSSVFIVAALGLLFALWSAGVIFKVQTPDGTVIVEIDNSRATVPVSVAEDGAIIIRDPNDGQPITVTVDRDKKQLRLEKSGFEIVVRQFSLDTPDGARIKVSFVANDAKELDVKPRSPAVLPGDPNVITVSQDTADQGQHLTINEALSAAKPWSTIRVLDSATYQETVQFDDEASHQGITLESRGGATIEGLAISNVSHVVVRGFRVQADPVSPGVLVRVSGMVGGVLLDSLELRGLSNQSTSILVTSPRLGPSQRPLVIQRCRFAGGQALSIRGTPSQPASGVCVRENHIVNCAEGVELQGAVEGVQVVGNTIRDCVSGGIDLQNLAKESRDLLIANNTVVGCGVGFLVFDPGEPNELAIGPVDVAGNLFFEAGLADMVFLRQPSQSQPPIPQDGRALVRDWRFRNNWRDMSGAEALSGLPLANLDHSSVDAEFASREVGHQDYMRPTSVDIATGGVGGDLPGYAGAVPPKGAKPWDWDAVWRQRASRGADKSARDRKDR